MLIIIITATTKINLLFQFRITFSIIKIIFFIIITTAMKAGIVKLIFIISYFRLDEKLWKIFVVFIRQAVGLSSQFQLPLDYD